MSKKVIVAGHICVDMTPVFKGRKVTNISEILMPGKLVDVGDMTFCTGGAVANTGLAMKILGANVSLMGKTGDDTLGKIIHDVLRQYHVEQEMIVDPESSTSYTVVVAAPGIDRIFLHNPGANNTFCADDIPERALKDAALFHFGYPTIMRSMYKNGGRGMLEVFRKAKKAGCTISLDLSAVDPDSEAGAEDWRQILTDILPLVDIFVPSVEELCWMLNRDHYQEWSRRANGNDMTEVLNLEKDVYPLAEECMKLGTKILLIKCGVPGMYYRTAPKEVFELKGDGLNLDIDIWSNRSGFEKSFVPDSVLSGTGCGDTSIAAFLTGILNGYSPEKCVQLAAATGACCVASYDSLSGLKSFEQLEKKIADGWKKINNS